MNILSKESNVTAVLQKRWTSTSAFYYTSIFSITSIKIGNTFLRITFVNLFVLPLEFSLSHQESIPNPRFLEFF